MTQSMIDRVQNALKNLNILAVIDHSGRAGNAFFLTVFDQHFEVLSCPLMHYTYSYIISEFTENEIDAQKAYAFLTQKSYFRLLYNPSDFENSKLIQRMGMKEGNFDDKAIMIRQYTEQFFKTREMITRQELALIPFIIYALAFERNIENMQYVLISDAISLRTENVNTGYSGKVIDAIIQDFPQAKLINLVRDPRATFASPRHQFVNWLGNMYALKPGKFFERLKDMWKKNLAMDNTCVYLFWLLYLAQSARTVMRKKNEYKENFISVRNEDLNHHFLETLTTICQWLHVELDSSWQSPHYFPTILGNKWLGTGAYNSRYQTVTNGRLQNESEEISQKIAGPNTYVTQRWKEKLNKREIRLIERLFKEELAYYHYEILYDNASDSDLKNYLLSSIFPFEGELPNIKWIMSGLKDSPSEFFNRVYYLITFLPFYISSRVVLMDYVFRKKFFKNIYA